MSHTRADAFNNYLVPLILLTPICCLYNIGVYEGYALYGYTVLILLAHIRYGFNVVSMQPSAHMLGTCGLFDQIKVIHTRRAA